MKVITTEHVTKSRIPYQAYEVSKEYRVGFFLDGSGILIANSFGNEVGFEPEQAKAIIQAIRYSTKQCKRIQKETEE